MEGALPLLSFPFPARLTTEQNEQASEIPTEDLASGDAENTGCLISEVVVPGFDFADHEFLNYKGLVELFRGDEKARGVEELRSYVEEK